MAGNENRPGPIASPTIRQVLDAFLEEQESRVKRPTFRRYADIIHLFRDCMNDYAYQYLSGEDKELFESFYSLRGQGHREFCDIFGPAKIPSSVSEFLNYFMIRKVMCGKDLLRAAGTVTKRLIKWLEEHGHVDPESAEYCVERASRASKELPAMEELSELMWRYAQSHWYERIEETTDGYFLVRRVEGNRLYLEDLGGGEVALSVPADIAKRCRVGWSINLSLGKTAAGWKILDVGNVYPY